MAPITVIKECELILNVKPKMIIEPCGNQASLSSISDMALVQLLRPLELRNKKRDMQRNSLRTGLHYYLLPLPLVFFAFIFYTNVIITLFT